MQNVHVHSSFLYDRKVSLNKLRQILAALFCLVSNYKISLQVFQKHLYFIWNRFKVQVIRLIISLKIFCTNKIELPPILHCKPFQGIAVAADNCPLDVLRSLVTTNPQKTVTVDISNKHHCLICQSIYNARLDCSAFQYFPSRKSFVFLIRTYYRLFFDSFCSFIDRVSEANKNLSGAFVWMFVRAFKPAWNFERALCVHSKTLFIFILGYIVFGMQRKK